MQDNQVHIEIKDGKIRQHSRKPISMDDLMVVLQTIILGGMNQIVDNASEEIKEGVKEHLYDVYNEAASATLQTFAPEIELRPDLTTDAILEAENKLINEGKAPSLKVVE